MSKSIIRLLTFVVLIAPLPLLLAGGENDASRLRDLPVDAQGVPMLKDIYQKDFLTGTALDFTRPNEYSARELEIIKSQFNVATPENSMKPASIHPAEGRWDWAEADALVTFCQANDIQVTGHTLVWHNQTGRWFFRGPDGAPVGRELALARLKEHIETVVSHFKGKVKGWDVVNEAISDTGSGDTENLRPSPWFRAIGPDYISWAFKFAHEADPHAELYYNDYNIERGAKHQSSLLLLKRMIREGVPITAVGIQGHWSLTYLPYAELDQAIADYQALGLKVNISELDVTIAGQGGGQLVQAGGAAGPATQRAQGFGRPYRPPTPQQLQAQADAYAKFFHIFQKHKDVIIRVTFWGISDRRSWRARQSPLLFDNLDNPKPAIRAIALAKE